MLRRTYHNVEDRHRNACLAENLMLRKNCDNRGNPLTRKQEAQRHRPLNYVEPGTCWRVTLQTLLLDSVSEDQFLFIMFSSITCVEVCIYMGLPDLNKQIFSFDLTLCILCFFDSLATWYQSDFKFFVNQDPDLFVFSS